MRLPRLTFIVAFCALISGISASQTKKAVPVSVINLLRSREPSIVWDQRSLLKADLDFDGVDDYALGGKAGGRYVVGIVKGPVTNQSRHWILAFPQNTTDQGSLCSVSTAHIMLESPGVEGNLPANSKGINLSDGECDSFHIYWDKDGKRFVWARS